MLKTPSGFLEAVNQSTPIAFAEMVAGLTEADRKKLSKAAQDLLRKAVPQERARAGWPTHEGHMARLALLAVGPRSQACRPMRLEDRPHTPSMVAWHTIPGPNPYEDAAVQILADRRPDWADDWPARQLSEDSKAPGRN
ncbi:MAG TPA: hypothetical protein VNH11_14775 [Pirellulales bacterium]|nr:hypothetical protein [Pirellulales bacterium]